MTDKTIEGLVSLEEVSDALREKRMNSGALVFKKAK